jgi:DNA-damage-inducible protein J
MTTVSLRIEEKMKKELDEMCEEMGMNITTFFMIYAKRALRDRRIPFDIIAPKDTFYSKENTECIKASMQQVREGKVVQKTMEELEAMESE